jgi:dienelactone hydrolase
MDGALRLSGFREPLGLWRHRAGPPQQQPGLRAERIEYSSRGDRATGRLWLPRHTNGELPVVLVAHRAGESAASPEIEAIALRLAQRGAAVAAIDFPLHGGRGDAKLGARLARALSGERDAAPGDLVQEFARQAVVDLERALDACASLPELDLERVGYVGLGLGARIGAAFAGLDARVRAVALAFPGAGDAADALDAGAFVARIAPRPLLLIHAGRSDADGARGARALFEAAGDPKQESRVGSDVPGDPAVQQALERFLAPALGLRDA